jgi:hypothetical protein
LRSQFCSSGCSEKYKKRNNKNKNLGKRRSDQFVFRQTNRQILKEETSMNKIYKVVWSKAKHCYVVTSELAKRQTKGCGARSLRMATVSLGVAASLLCSGAVLPIFGDSVAEAKTTTEKQGNKIINTTTHYTTVFNFQYPEKSVTIGATEINEVTNAYGVFGNVAQRVGQQKTDNVTFTVIDGQLIEIHDVNQYYLEPYQRVLTGHPFNFSNGTDSDIDDEIKNSDGAKSDVTGYSLTIRAAHCKKLQADFPMAVTSATTL